MLFSKLTEEQQKKVYEANPQLFSDTGWDWWEPLIEDLTVALSVVGFDDVKIGFSGFCFQGDGAHFTGSYSYKKGALAKIKSEYPGWIELHELASELQKLESKDFYAITFTIRHKGHYNHENCTSFDFEDSRDSSRWLSDELEQDYKYVCRAFMQHIYNILEQRYRYLESWEYVKECPEVFDYVDIAFEE